MTIRKSLVEIVKRIDRAIGHARGPRRVLIEVRSPMNLEVLRPVWTCLLQDRRVEITFTSEEEGWVHSSLAADGLADRLITQREAQWRRFDLSFNADPWNAQYLRRCWRRLNFFHGVAGKYDLDDPMVIGRNIDFSIYDRLMFANEDRLRRYVDSGLVPPERAALVGFPKVDDLVNGRWSASAVRTELGLDPALETVLYAPTFSPASSLHLAGEALIDRLLATGRNVIVKLHDRSMMPHPKYTANVDWLQRLARFRGRPRYAFATGAHAGPYLAAADVLVTDHSTIGFEFGLLDRPVVIFDVPELLHEARINVDKWNQLRSMADIAQSVDELADAIDLALADPSRHAAARRTICRNLFAHAGHATERALDVVYELLDLSPPKLQPLAVKVPQRQGTDSVREVAVHEVSS
jgi:hypothetical protein